MLFSKLGLAEQNSCYIAFTVSQPALANLKNALPPQEFDEYEKALNLYSSRSDTSKFTKEEAAQVFPVLFNVGKASTTEAEGLKWFSHALKFGKQIQSIDNPTFASIAFAMGDLYQEREKLNEAMECLGVALSIFDSSQLNNEQKLEKCRCRLLKAAIARGRGDLDEACQTLAPCFPIIEELSLSQEDVADVGTGAYEMMVNMQYHRGDQEKAHEYSKKGLDFMEKAHGLDCYQGHNLARELACTLLKEDKFSEAFVYVRKWHNMLRKEHGEDELPMITCYFLYGQICSEMKNYADALKQFEKSEKAKKKNKNIKFADGGEVFIYKARCYFNLEQFKEAKENFDKAVKYNTKNFGSPSRKLADCLFTGAGILEGSKLFYDEAKDLYFKALEMYKILGPACLFETMSTLSSIGFFFHRAGEFKEAVKYAGESLQLCKQYFSGNIPRLESCHNGLGMAQFRSGDLQNGLVNLELAAKFCENLNNSSGNLISHYFNLVQIYSEMKQYEKVELYGKKILEMDFAKNGKSGTWIKGVLEYLGPALSNLEKEDEFKQLQLSYTEI